VGKKQVREDDEMSDGGLQKMSEEEYVSERLEGQIKWYDMKSRFNKRWFVGLKSVELVIATSIPFVVGFISREMMWLKFVAGFLGLLVAVVSGIQSVFKFHENWIQYRTTAETLKHEKFLYLTKVRPYDGKDAFNRLVERVESLISKEHSRWSHYSSKEEESLNK